MATGSRKRSSKAGDDFVVSGDDDHLPPKRAKTNLTKTMPSSKLQEDLNSNTKLDSNGDRYWEISKMRRVTVSSFRGKTMVNIREYYEKDGQELPGKKGISMPMDQFASFISLLPNIEIALGENGESIPRPDYTGSMGQSVDNSSEGRESPGNKLQDSASVKQNIETTSEEDGSDE